MNLQARREALKRLVWETDLHSQARPRALLIRVLRLAAVVVRDVVQGQLRLQTMSLVYTSLLALIPLLAVTFSILKAFGAHDLLKPMLLGFLAPLEGKGVELTNQILQFISKMRVGVLGALGVGLLLYTSTSLVRKVELAFNSIWHVRRGRRLARRLGDYTAVLVVGPLLFFAALGVTASLASTAAFKPLHGVATVAAKVVPYLLVIGAYWLVYVFIPNTKVKLRSAFVGAAVAGILWQTAGVAFTAIVAGSGEYRAVYASLAILILFIVWLYLSWLILLIGAAIAHYHQHPERVTREPGEQAVLLSNRRRERLGLMIARLIGEHYYAGRPAWSAEALARRLEHPSAAVEQLLAAYAAQGLLARTRDNPAGYLPTCPLETVPLTDILRIIRTTGVERGPDPPDATVDHLMEEMAGAANRMLAGRTWRDLVVAEAAPASAAVKDKAGRAG